MRHIAIFLTIGLVTPIADAAIYKCQGPSTNAVTYTDRRCPPGQQQEQQGDASISWIKGSGSLDQKPAIRNLLRQASERSQRERTAATKIRHKRDREVRRKQDGCVKARKQRSDRWNAPRERRRELQRKAFLACQ